MASPRFSGTGDLDPVHSSARFPLFAPVGGFVNGRFDERRGRVAVDEEAMGEQSGGSRSMTSVAASLGWSRRSGMNSAQNWADEVGDMADVEIRTFEQADENRTFEHGSFELVTIGGVTIGRASYEPGWIWSQHVGKANGQTMCPVEHVGLVVSGRAGVKMADGAEFVLAAGDLYHVAPGHDSWVIGDEPYVSLHFLGATDYAKRD